MRVHKGVAALQPCRWPVEAEVNLPLWVVNAGGPCFFQQRCPKEKAVQAPILVQQQFHKGGNGFAATNQCTYLIAIARILCQLCERNHRIQRASL